MDLSPFLFLVFLSTIPAYPYLAKSSPHNNITDLESLLAFKADVADPLGILSSNWTTNTSFCNWIGVACSRRHLQRVAALNLHNITLRGTISPYIGNLSFLSLLALGNAKLSGPIPYSLTRLPRLRTLRLEGNSLSSSIPPNLFNMSSLVGIYLSTNELWGALPIIYNQSIAGSAQPPLRVISIGDNRLTGGIPSGFSHFFNLESLSLLNNNLSGPMPADIGFLSQLRLLYLSNNILSGEIPPSLGNITGLEMLEISFNKLSGGIPDTLSLLQNLRRLALSENYFEGEIPKELGNLSSLQELLLGVNNLIGSIPAHLFNASMMNHFDLGDNHLTGSVPPVLGKSMLTYVNVEFNQLSGGLEFITSLLDSVGNLSTSLEYFRAKGNRFKGNIHPAFGNLSGLLLLDLEDNKIKGTIPPSLSELRSLQRLSLANNQINGSIPIELGMLTSLSYLDLSGNKLSGAVPGSLSNLTGLQFLSLYGNSLSSKIPHSLWSLRNLIQLNLSRNALHGPIPPEVSNLNALGTLDLSENKFSGSITSSLGKLQMLRYLNLSKNTFTGQIPRSFGGLINIEYLNLSNNLLSGDIPESIGNLRYLDILDLSFNKLAGQIPQGRVFLNVTIPSLEGNTALCGAPLLKSPPCSAKIVHSHSRREIHLLQYVLPVISLLVASSCLFLIFIIHRRRKRRNLAGTEQFVAEHRVISYHDLARATDKFNETNLLGRGSFGSVFRGSLDDGLIVAVKVLDMEVEGASKSFDVECEALSRARHRNLIKIISVCSSLDFKALILEFMPNGSLEQWLYSENSYLNLLQRLNIMADVSSALEYLHHHHPQVILHCDLKPSNILLNEEMVAHVSDFGIANLSPGNSSATASKLGTVGYIAPEYGSTGKVSTMGDVYSFGILLMEMFTGRKPTDVIFDGESSFRECISKAYPNSLFDVVDDNLFKGGPLTESQSEDKIAMHQCVLSIIELGLLCTNYSPRERISMINVVPRMQKIKMEYMSRLPTG